MATPEYATLKHFIKDKHSSYFELVKLFGFGHKVFTPTPTNTKIVIIPDKEMNVYKNWSKCPMDKTQILTD
jgi:hypothetical protein